MVLLRSSVVLLSAVALWSQTDDAAEKAQQARELVVAGRPEEAIPIYQKLVRAFPKNAGMLVDLSIAEFKARRYSDAAAHAETALQIEPDSAAANLFLGSSYVELHEPLRAVAPLEKVIAVHPNDRNARLMLAEALLALERYEDAAVQFQKASELAPENPKVWYGLGRSFEALSDRTFHQLDTADHDSPYCNFLVADAFLRQRRYGSAFAHYQKALVGSASLRGVHAGLAAVYRQTGHADWALAEEEREKTLQVPDCNSGGLACDFAAGRYREIAKAAESAANPEALFWASKAYAELARQAYIRLSRLPSSLESHLHSARTLEAEALDRDAAREWREALKDAPGDARIETALVWSLFRARDYEEALPLLQELLNRQRNSCELNFLYGASLTNLEQPQQAVPYLETAVRLDGQFLPARAALGQALLRTGKAEQAIPHLRAALVTDEEGSAHFQLLRAYQVTNQTVLARQALAEYRQAQKSLNEKTRMEAGGEITPP